MSQRTRLPAPVTAPASDRRPGIPRGEVSRRAAGRPLTGPGLLQVQRTRGNRFVQRAVQAARRSGTELTIGPAGDRYEREADQVADRLTRTGALRSVPATSATGSGGQLAPQLRRGYEDALGADLSAVRIHTGQEAARASGDLGAMAFTHGADVYFGAGHYAPGTVAGRWLLAHELAHVAQQGAAPALRPTGPADVAPVPGGQVPAIQRKLDWHNTMWADAKKAWSSPGGARGVVFVTDEKPVGADPVVIKAGEDAVAEAILNANLHNIAGASGDWMIGAPGVRSIGADEAKAIKRVVAGLVWGDAKAAGIIRNVDKPGATVSEYAAGEELKDLIAPPQKHSRKAVGFGRELRDDSPFQLFQDKQFLIALGRISAVDIMAGNSDRLTGMWNPENLKLDRTRQQIHLIDNVHLAGAGYTFKTNTYQASDAAYRAWTGLILTQQLRVDDVGSIADKIIEVIADGIRATRGIRLADALTVRAVLVKGKPLLEQGVAEGKKALYRMLLKYEDVLHGIPNSDKDEVRASLQKRITHLFT